MAAVRSRVFRGPPRHTDARCVRKPIFADSADSDSDVRDLSPLDSQHDAATPLHHAAEEGDVSLIRAPIFRSEWIRGTSPSSAAWCRGVAASCCESRGRLRSQSFGAKIGHICCPLT